MRSIRLKHTILTEKFPEATVIFNVDQHLPWALNATAAEIVDFCRQRRTESEIVDHLHKSYGVQKQKLKKDVKLFLSGLKRKGMVDIHVR